MPWETRRSGDEWCVYKVGESKPVGCHASRERALAQQRALYANEDKMTASVPATRIELLPPSDQAVPALIAAVDTISERLVQSEQALSAMYAQIEKIISVMEADREAIVKALTAAVQVPQPEPPVVNVTVPEIVVPEPRVEVNVPAPVVNVELPERKVTRHVTVNRNLEGRLEGAVIEETEGA